MGAELLREAATVLRERASAATPPADPYPGGWSGYVMDDGRCEMFAGPADAGYRTGLVFSFTDHGECEACARPGWGDINYIETMHPGVGLALADWLDHEARVREESDRQEAYFPFARAVQSDAVATAILGVGR